MTDLPRLNQHIPITDNDRPTLGFHIDWQKIVDTLESVNGRVVAAQPDSVAVTVAALVVDFNAFLAKLRAAKLMLP